MNTVDFVGDGSRVLSPQSSVSRVSSKAQKESYNAFLAKQGGDYAPSTLGKSNSKEYSLSDHFSGDSSEKNTQVKHEGKKLQNDPSLATDGSLLLGSLQFSFASDLMPKADFTETGLPLSESQPKLNFTIPHSPFGAENSSQKLSKGKSVLPKGLIPVKPEKIQPLVQQSVLNTLAQSGTLDAQKTTSMYHPISSADLATPKRGFSEGTFDVRGVLRSDTAQAVSAASHGQQRQDQEHSSKDNSRERQQQKPVMVLNQTDIQSRIDPMTVAVVEQQNSSSTATGLQTAENLNPVIMDHMDRLLKSQQKQLRVKLELPNGDVLSLHLKLENESVHVRFESDSKELLDSLEEGWRDLEQTAQEKGVAMAKPQFERSPSLSA